MEEQQPVFGIELPAKMYTTKGIRVATFLGGPLVAGYLIAENFKAFNEADKVKKTWLYTIIATVVIFGVAFLLPESGSSGRIIFPLIYSWVAYYIVQNYQGTQMDTFTNTGGETVSWWRVIGVGLIGCIITLLILFIIIYSTGA
jgi:hypothetical protein